MMLIKYNRVYMTNLPQEGLDDIAGWKLVRGDVFRNPSREHLFVALVKFSMVAANKIRLVQVCN